MFRGEAQGYIVDGEPDTRITTPADRSKPQLDDRVAVLDSLHPKLEAVKQQCAIPGTLKRKPLFRISSSLVKIFVKLYLKAIYETRDTCTETNFLFHEVCFALLCMATCSSELLSFALPDYLITEPYWG